MGYQPPFINLETLKTRLTSRINYYSVELHVTYKGTLEIWFTRGRFFFIITCPRKENK